MSIINGDLRIEIQRGDTYTRDLVFTDDNGDPFDLTSWTVYVTVRKFTGLNQRGAANNDTDALIHKTYSGIPNPELGIIQLEFTQADTRRSQGVYAIDISMEGNGQAISTRVGQFIINNDVTWTT